MQTADEGVDIQETAVIFLLTLKENHRLTQSAVDFAVGYVRQNVNNQNCQRQILSAAR